MTGIGIIGTGISGLTLALRLQQLGVDATLYAEAPPDAMRSARLPNTVGRFPHTLARERVLGVDHWPQPEYAMGSLQFRAGPPLGIGFDGRFPEPMRSVDFRLLLPRMLDDFADRGGRVEVEADIDAARIDRLSARHELVVVAVGRRSVAQLFPVDPTRSPYDEPQRHVFAGLFEGLALPEGPAVSFNVAPGVGEVFQWAMWTADGLATSLLALAVPGGPMTAVTDTDADDPAFLTTLTELLAVHAPAVAARVEPGGLRLRSGRDWLRGAVRPAVRHGWCELPSGRLAVAVGDAWITNDPLTGQGANLGSHSAWVAADHIAAGGRFDRDFGRRLEADMWEYAGAVTRFSNAFLQPPPPHVVELMFAAAADQAVADRYVRLFDDPPSMWRAVSTSVGAADFLEQSRSPAGVPA